MPLHQNIPIKTNVKFETRKFKGYDANGDPIYGPWKVHKASLLQRIEWFLGLSTPNLSTDDGQDFIAGKLSGSEETNDWAEYIALSSSTTAPVETDSTLTGEISDAGLDRTGGTYSHTAGQQTYTLLHTWTCTATTTVRQSGIFDDPSAGSFVWGASVTPVASLATNDELKVTWTVSGF